MKFISIGPYCTTANILIKNNLRMEAYPFDYIFSSLEIVKHCIDDKFKIFLDKKYYEFGNSNYTTRHTLYCNMLDTPILKKHFSIYKDFKMSSANLFNHHNLIDNINHYESYKRRCDRLLNLIENNEKIVFVYYNCYTDDFNDLIYFSNTFSNNKNIFILGIFENTNEKKILYQNTNCKIYQNYDQSDIFNEIKSEF